MSDHMHVRNGLVVERVGEGVRITIVKHGERGGFLWAPLPLNQVALMWLNRQCPLIDRRQTVRSIVENAVTAAIVRLAGGLDPAPRCSSCGHAPNACECQCCIGPENPGGMSQAHRL